MKKLTALISSTALFFTAVGSVFAESSVNITVNQPSNLKIGDFGKLLSASIGAVLIISALAAFIYLIWGGIQWITSGGDKSATEAARNRIQAAILGLFIVFAAWAIMLVIGNFFGFSITNLSFPTPF